MVSFAKRLLFVALILPLTFHLVARGSDAETLPPLGMTCYCQDSAFKDLISYSDLISLIPFLSSSDPFKGDLTSDPNLLLRADPCSSFTRKDSSALLTAAASKCAEYCKELARSASSTLTKQIVGGRCVDTTATSCDSCSPPTSYDPLQCQIQKTSSPFRDICPRMEREFGGTGGTGTLPTYSPTYQLPPAPSYDPKFCFPGESCPRK